MGKIAEALRQPHGKTAAASNFPPPALTQDECVQWDEGENFDLREEAHSPCLPRNNDSTKELQPKAEKNGKMESGMTGVKPGKSSETAIGGGGILQRQRGNENQSSSVQSDDFAAPTPRQSSVGSSGPCDSNGSQLPAQIMATDGVTFRTRTKNDAHDFQETKQKRRHSIDGSGRVGDTSYRGVRPLGENRLESRDANRKRPTSSCLDELLTELDTPYSAKSNPYNKKRRSFPPAQKVPTASFEVNRRSSAKSSASQMPALSKMAKQAPPNAPRIEDNRHIERQSNNSKVEKSGKVANTGIAPKKNHSMGSIKQKEAQQEFDVVWSEVDFAAMDALVERPSTTTKVDASRKVAKTGMSPKKNHSMESIKQKEDQQEYDKVVEWSEADYAAMDALVCDATKRRGNLTQVKNGNLLQNIQQSYSNNKTDSHTSSKQSQHVGQTSKSFPQDEAPEWSEADYAAMDALVSDATKRKGSLNQMRNGNLQSVQQSENNKSDSRTISKHSLRFGKNTKSTHTIKTTESAPLDAFGDFPDMDFDSLDKEIAQHQVLSQSNCNTRTLGNPGQPTTKISTSRKSSSVSFTNFSRYKVLQLQDDQLNYQKKLFVAEWTKEMNHEETRKELHKCEKDARNGSLIAKAPNGESVTSIPDGSILLKGEWYHTELSVGDTIHVCSLTGKCRTDTLPLELHTQRNDIYNDVVLVVHPDVLVTPTMISEAVSCSRRAILRSRISSPGLRSKHALLGTMRHALFERCMSTQDVSTENAGKFTRTIARKFAESLVGCGLSDAEAERDILAIMPELRRFYHKYTTARQNSNSPDSVHIHSGSMLQGHGRSDGISFTATSVRAVEECAVSPGLGLKGNVDATVEALTSLPGKENSQAIGAQRSLMGIELKTGHNQKPQTEHMAQLALYTMMLRTRYGSTTAKASSSTIDPVGAASGGMLLYLNHESHRALHVSATLSELKSLIGQRNVVATEIIRASKPRGIVYSNVDESLDVGVRFQGRDLVQRVALLDAPPALLPEIRSSPESCSRCYTNRECMLYKRAELEYGQPRASGVDRSHGQLLSNFTGHLDEDDITYFREWDRLIDLEAHACTHSPTESWLHDPKEREKLTGKCVSSLVIDEAGTSKLEIIAAEADQNIYFMSLLKLERALDSQMKTPISNLRFEKGSYVILSTETTTLGTSQATHVEGHLYRHQMNILRGKVESVDAKSLTIRSSSTDIARIRKTALQQQQKRNGDCSTNRTCISIRFRLDLDEISTGIGTLRLNLVNLFTGDSKPILDQGNQIRQNGDTLADDMNPLRQRMAWLRDAIVRFRKPVFKPVDPEAMFDKLPKNVGDKLRSDFLLLNPDQRNAVTKVLATSDYTLIQGMPGTGKTSTIEFVCRLLAAQGKRVLVSSYTHAAVDNLMMKLMEKDLDSYVTKDRRVLPVLVRVGQASSCHPCVHSILADVIASGIDHGPQIENHARASAANLQAVMSSASVVGATTLTIPKSPLLFGQHFDVVIVDEAGQISQPAILGALMAADSFILAGDHMQLPPLVVSSVADEGGYGVSMLKRLADRFPESVAQLTLQYRMHNEICRLCNDIVYQGKLKCANDAVRTHQLDLPGYSLIQSTSWIADVANPRKPVVFVNTDSLEKCFARIATSTRVGPASAESSSSSPSTTFVGLESTDRNKASGKVVNRTEIEIAKMIIQYLAHCGLQTSSIGIISPFRAQVREFDECNEFREWKESGLEISTIDRFQGRDKQVILVSFVRSNSKGKSGRLLEDFRRLNVAFSRAKKKLIMLGSFCTLQKGSTVLQPVLAGVKQRQQVLNLPSNALSGTCFNQQSYPNQSGDRK